MSPLIVGLMPNRTNLGPPLTGQIGRRLSRWSGLTPFQYLRHFDRININARHHARLDFEEANELAMEIYFNQGPRPTILCGREVAKLFDLERLPYYQWTGFGYVVIPHPSGRCRLYNDPVNRWRTGVILREALERSEDKAGHHR